MATEIYILGFGLILVGVVLIIAGAVLAYFSRGKKGTAKTAGVIMIGPVPIVFGSDKKSVKTLLTLSIALTALLVVGMLVYYFLFRLR